MRQFTTPEQTAKLIELGFEKPKIASPRLKRVDGVPTFELRYTIGELIEMLPPKLGGHHLSIERYIEYDQWLVCYEISMSGSIAPELCDALYNMIVRLKKEGVI